MEFVAGVIVTLFVEFIAYKVLSKKYEIVKLPEPPKGTGGGGGGGGGSRPGKDLELQ